MEDLNAYHRIAQKIEEQEPHTAPKAEDESIHEAFIGYLRLKGVSSRTVTSKTVTTGCQRPGRNPEWRRPHADSGRI